MSVALCTYDGATHLARQLDSIEAQTVLPDEVVISDDGSTDATLDVVADYQRRSRSQVRVLRRSAPLGVVGNFETALRECQGDVVLLADQDDVWAAHKVERLVACLRRHPRAQLVFSDADLVDDADQPVGRTLWQALDLSPRDRRRLGRAPQGVSVLLRESVVTGAMTGLRRDLLGCALPVPRDAGMLHDAWLALVASCHGGVVPLAERLVRYRQHDAQHTGAPAAGHGRRPVVVAADRLHEELRRQRHEASLLLSMLADCPHEPAERSRRFLRNHVAHVEARLGSRSSRVLVRELLAGRYHRHSTGLRSVVKDLARRP